MNNTVTIRIYPKDLERLNYLFCEETKEVPEELATCIKIKHADLISYLLDKLENAVDDRE